MTGTGLRDVAVIGCGITDFGELWDRSFRDLIVDAGLQAVEASNIQGEQLDAIYVGSMSAGRFVGQEHIAPLLVDAAGLASEHTAATRIEGAGASGGIAFRQAFLAVASGHHDIVAVGGAEKMTDVDDKEVTETLRTSADQEWEAFFGATFPSLYAMIARLHMHRYGTTREQLAEVAVKNHRHGARNPRAQYQRETTVERVLGAGMVADPLTMYDCHPITDGAAAVVLCPMERAREFTDAPVRVLSSAQASDTLALHSRPDITTFGATAAAAKRAFDAADREIQDVDVAEVDDAYTISEILSIEDLGFFAKGKGGPATEDGLTALDGEVPVNTSGGLKARGHPIGATGVAQIVELFEQLRGEAGDRQVDGAATGLAHCIGGSGASAVVSLLEVS